MQDKNGFSCGIPSLDSALQGIQAGDNIVFQVDRIEDSRPFVERYCRYTQTEGKRLVYFRFADHPSFLPEGVEAEQYNLDPEAGFEQFIFKILSVIEKNGRGAYYLFDCLSGLAAEWYSDRMLGNFFMLACPYLYTYDTVTYFVLLKNVHTPLAVRSIHKTAQVILDVFSSGDDFYIRPIKVLNRFSPTMYMLHSFRDESFHPVTKSIFLSEILSIAPQPWIDVNMDRHDLWSEMFKQAQNISNKRGEMEDRAKEDFLKTRLIKMALTREENLIPLCEKYFSISNLVDIGKRMIGTGLIGGKAVGMLLARRIIEKECRLSSQGLETHDSFYIGSDVYYSYVIQNNCWWERHRLKYCEGAETVCEKADSIHQKLRAGHFPPDILEQFREMLNYFGQSPIIVRSSSLLEDAFGNSFSGKYESVFCANQGNPEERLHSFLEAVREVYASTMSREALSYRLHRGLFQQDEQMAILIQRVSGEYYQHLYFPQIGGVAYSFNPFVWDRRIDPKQGVMRIVFGLGTRAVDRIDDDYTRVVSLNEPMLRPEGSSDKVRKYSQKMAHVLDLRENKLSILTFEQIARMIKSFPIDIFASRDTEMEERAKELHMTDVFSYLLTFTNFLTRTSFTEDMKKILSTLSSAYSNPVDIEFTVNFLDDSNYRINLLQCRPFQFTGGISRVKVPDDLSGKNVILRSLGPLIGYSSVESIERIIYIVPEKYGLLPISKRYEIAHLIGKLTNLPPKIKTMLIGPGRWGTSMPELGIPVSLSEIKNASVLCEVAEMHEGLNPDLSLGTHFFNDLVDLKILYMGISPAKTGELLNKSFLLNCSNKFGDLLPEEKSIADIIRVIDFSEVSGPQCSLFSDTLEQQGIVFVSENRR